MQHIKPHKQLQRENSGPAIVKKENLNSNNFFSNSEILHKTDTKKMNIVRKT